jgi:hypothetical protein
MLKCLNKNKIMQDNKSFYQLLFFDSQSQSCLNFIAFPSQTLMHYPDPKYQIQNLPNLESRFPIENSVNFAVEIVESDGKTRKYSLEELAKIVPSNLFEGLLERKIENGELKIISDKKIDDSSANKILIKTGDDSYAVIPNYLIKEAREKKGEMDSILSAPWGHNINPHHEMEKMTTIIQPINSAELSTPTKFDPLAGSTVRQFNNDKNKTVRLDIPEGFKALTKNDFSR